jgi:Flp pilus assembly protein TadD
VVHTRDGLAQRLQAAGLDPASVVQPHRLTDAMRAWAHEQVPESLPDAERLRLLFAALQDPDRLGLTYEPGNTATAIEVFETRRFNCLSFSHLFVAMARELGMPVYYMSVPGRDGYSDRGDLVVVSGHVTAGYGFGPTRLVLEYNTGRDMDLKGARPITDERALALFYGGRGVEQMLAGDDGAARRWLEIAVVIDPEYADGWTNLGVARRRSGDLEAAEQAYRTAIELDPESVNAYHNLVSLFRIQGNRDASHELLALLDRRSTRNPFIYLALGDASLDEGRIEEARRFYRRAYSVARKAAEPRAALGQLALISGDREQARRWLERARQIDGEDGRVIKLARALDGGEDGT